MKSKIIVHNKKYLSPSDLAERINKELERLNTFHQGLFEGFDSSFNLGTTANTDYFLRLAGILNETKKIIYVSTNKIGLNLNLTHKIDDGWIEFLDALQHIDYIEI